MFFGNVLLDKSGPYALLWKAAHSTIKSLPRSEVKHFDAVQKCENLIDKIPGPLTQIDTKTKFSLYLISNLLYGIVIVVKRQGDLLLVDVEELRATFCVSNKTKRKRLFCGETSYTSTPKRSKFIKDMLINKLSPVADYNDPMDKLDQAFLNNRIEVARLEDITLKEVDIGLSNAEQFSDALTDFGEKSTEREQVLSFNEKEKNPQSEEHVLVASNSELQTDAEHRDIESCNKTLEANTDLTHHVNDIPTTPTNNIDPLLQSVENTEINTVKVSDNNCQHLANKRKARFKKQQAKKPFGIQRDKETTIPLVEFNERIKNSSLYQRSRSSLFDVSNNKTSENLLLERRFATTFANKFFGEDWVPMPREVKPMSFEEALHYGRETDGENILDRIIDVEIQDDEAPIEGPRNSSSAFAGVSASKSAVTTSGLVDDLKISSIADSSSIILPKISEPLDSISLEDEVELGNNYIKASDLLHDISIDSPTVSRAETPSKKSPVVLREDNQQSILNLNTASEECQDDVPQIQEPALENEVISSRASLTVSFDPSITTKRSKLAVFASSVSLDEFFQQIQCAVKRKGGVISFSELFHSSSRATVAKCFSFLLTLLKEQKIDAIEEEPFGDIKIHLIVS